MKNDFHSGLLQGLLKLLRRGLIQLSDHQPRCRFDNSHFVSGFMQGPCGFQPLHTPADDNDTVAAFETGFQGIGIL
ncbi:hypothetical protein D3C73_1471210 [compost metagenome]